MNAVDLALLFGLAAIWGASFLFIAEAVEEMSPLMLVFIRLALASVSLFVIRWALRLFRSSNSDGPSLSKMWRSYLYVAIMNSVIPYVLIAWGEERIASGAASILNATTPLFTAVLAATVIRAGGLERLTPLRVAGLVVGFAGVGVLVLGSGQDLSVGAQTSVLLGQLAVLVAAAAYGVSGLYARRAFDGVPPMLPATWQNVFGALILLPFAWLLTPLTRVPSWQATGSIVALGIGGTAIALLMYFQLLARVGATRTVMVTYLLPVMALIYGAAFRDESIGPFTVLGLGLVLLGITLTIRKDRPRETVAQSVSAGRDAETLRH